MLELVIMSASELTPSPPMLNSEQKTITKIEQLKSTSNKTHEKQVPSYAQALIDAHKQFNEFKHTFQRLENEEIPSTEVLSPPWDKIKTEIDIKKHRVNNVIKHVSGSTTPEELGTALFLAKEDRADTSPPQGSVQAYQKGSYILIVVDNEADLQKACNIKPDQNTKDEGIYQSRATYRFGEKISDTIAEVPTIVVVNRGGKRTEAITKHEENHHHMDMYTKEANPTISSMYNAIFSSIRARQATLEFNDGKLSEATFQEELKLFAQRMKSSAIFEMTAEMMGSEKFDNRDPYTDDIFRNIEIEGETPAKKLIEQAKLEFRNDFKLIQNALRKITFSFEAIETDKEAIYGTIGMKLCTTEGDQMSKVIQDMGFINDIVSGNEFYHLRQALNEQEESIRNASISRPLKEQLINEIFALSEQLLIEAQKTKPHKSYGYKDSRKLGDDFPSALSKAAIAREVYLENIQPISIKQSEISEEIKKQKQMEDARVIIALQTNNEQPDSFQSRKNKLLKKLKKLLK